MMIFKRKTNKPELIDRAPVGSIMGISDSGWTTSELFMDFMKHFAVHARCSPYNKTLLIFDGHNTHTKMFSRFCDKQGHLSVIFTSPCDQQAPAT